MNPRILNRSPLITQDGWIHIVPKGELPNEAAGIEQVLDDQSLDSILAEISSEKNRLGDKWPGIYAGREHFIYDPGQDSAALAWFRDFEKRDDGIWANEDGLTPAGADALKNREYKFTSFAASPSQLARAGGKSESGLPRYRVMGIETIGFTNQANGKELLTPITNRTNFGSHKTEAAWNAAGEENRQYVAANKAAQDKADDLRKKSTEGEALEFALPDLEKWFRAVENVMAVAKKSDPPMMAFEAAWTYARQKYPDLYTAAFGVGDEVPINSIAAGQRVATLANRISAKAGKSCQFGWSLVREQLPHIFNRMLPLTEQIKNRATAADPTVLVNKAAQVFARLTEAEQATNNMPPGWAFEKVKGSHPGLYALAQGTVKTYQDAIDREPGLANLLA